MTNSTEPMFESPHRQLARILLEEEIPRIEFAGTLGVTEKQLKDICFKQKIDLPTKKAVVQALRHFGVRKVNADAWQIWHEHHAKRPTIYYVLEEQGITDRDLEKIIGPKASRVIKWLTSSQLPASLTTVIKCVETQLIPYLINEKGVQADGLKDFRKRLTRQEWIAGDRSEIKMTVTRKQRQTLGLTRDPFTRKPYEEDQFFRFAHFDESIDIAVDTVEAGGIQVFSGMLGSGKSTLKDLILMELKKDKTNIVIDIQSIVTKDHYNSGQIVNYLLCKLMGVELGSYASLSMSVRMGMLLEELKAKANENRWIVVVLDECQKLEEDDFLIIKQLNEFFHKGQRLISFILFGQEMVKDRLNSAKLGEVRYRVKIQEIEPVSREEIIKFIKHRLAPFMEDGKPVSQLVTDEALEEMAERLEHKYVGRVTPILAQDAFYSIMKTAAEYLEKNYTQLPINKKVVQAAIGNENASQQTRKIAAFG